MTPPERAATVAAPIIAEKCMVDDVVVDLCR